MSNECRYAVTETLRNGTPVTIRAVRPNDRERLVTAFHKLDRESIYTRFFAYKDELSEADLKHVTEIDFERRVVLLVTIASGEGETVIGAGSYTACTKSASVSSAEVGFMVEEDYHGLGIAGRILHHLAVIARERGIGQFEAEVLPVNRAMVSVFARSGFPMTEEKIEGTIRLTMDLPDASPAG